MQVNIFLNVCPCVQLDKILCYSGNLNDLTTNGLERKKIVYFSFWEDIEILQGELKIKRSVNIKSRLAMQGLICQ